MNEVVAVVVTYNRKDILIKCIKCLMKQEYPCDILVVDNNSTDGTEECVRSFVEAGKICYYNTMENLGGAGGFRIGLELALKKGYSYMWMMDDDTLPQEDALKELFNADKRLCGEYGFLSSVALWNDGALCNMNIQRIGINKKVQDYTDISPVIMATFVSFFIKAETIKCVGFPIKDFFIWADDLEYSRRISKRLPCYMVPQSKVVHCMNSNQKVGIAEESIDRLWRYKYLYRNEVYVFRREGIKGYVYLIARMIKHTLEILYSSKKDKRIKITIIWNSFFSGFSFSPKVEYCE